MIGFILWVCSQPSAYWKVSWFLFSHISVSDIEYVCPSGCCLTCKLHEQQKKLNVIVLTLPKSHVMYFLSIMMNKLNPKTKSSGNYWKSMLCPIMCYVLFRCKVIVTTWEVVCMTSTWLSCTRWRGDSNMDTNANCQHLESSEDKNVVSFSTLAGGYWVLVAWQRENMKPLGISTFSSNIL